eukprot:15480745-Alexandrium_andersonii.AAC.1
MIDSKYSMGPEIAYRLRQAHVAFKKLHIVWRSSESVFPRALKIRVYNACIKSRLLYGLGASWLTTSEINRLNAFHCRCLRKSCI